MAYSRYSRRRPVYRRPRSYARRTSYPSYRRTSRVSVGPLRRRPNRRTTYQRRSRRVQSSGMAGQYCGSGSSREMDPGQKFILAQADPFETKSFGGKIPDSSTIPSIATPVQYNYSLTTPGTGLDQPNFAHCWAFYPTLQSCNIAAFGQSTTSWDWTNVGTVLSNSPQYTNFSTSFEAFRPVAHAIRISCPFAPTAATGFVHVALATESMYSGTGTVTAPFFQLASGISSMSGYTFYKRVTLASLTQSPLTIINKWTDESAFRYSSPFANPVGVAPTASNVHNQFHIPLSWGTLLIAVEGVSAVSTPATAITPLQAEIILHTENIPDKSGTLIGSTAAAFDSGVLNAVSQSVARTDFSHTEEQQDSHMNSFVNEVAQAAGNAGIDVGGLLRAAGRRVVGAGIDYALGRYGVGGVNNFPDRLMIQ